MNRRRHFLSVLSVLLTGAQAPPILAGLGTQSLCGGVVADCCLMVAVMTASFGPVSSLASVVIVALS